MSDLDEATERSADRVTQGSCGVCYAPVGALCLVGCPNADTQSSGQRGPRDHFEIACRGYKEAIERGPFKPSEEELEWLAAEEKRTAGR